MFFKLTNSLVIFQAMMNNLLRDMIKAEDVVVFTDDVIVETKTEKGHDNIVEEVLRRMAKNDLFVKPEKCVWKVREVEFLEVVIELDGVKMEKEKVQEVVDWPVLRSIKDVQKFLDDDEERYEMELERKIVEGIQEVKRKIYDGTSLSNTRLGYGDKSRGRYIRLYYKRSVVNEM